MSICSIADCERPHYAHGHCKLHYDRKRRGYSLEATVWGQHVGEWGAWYLTRPDGYLIRNRRLNRKTEYQLQHRAVMEDHLGRPLLPEENVHHKNGVRTDNRLENLELWSTSQPSGQRVEDKLTWARYIVGLYG